MVQAVNTDMIFAKKNYTPGFQAKNLTPQMCVICKIVHARYKSVIVFHISDFGIFVRIELNFTVFEKKEPEICVLISRENMFFLEKFTPLAKLLHCRRQ